MVREVRLECKKAVRGRIWDGWYECVVGEGDLSFRVVVEEDKRGIPRHPHLAEQ